MGLIVPPVAPVRETAPVGLTAYWETVCPIWNEFSPATLIDIEIVEFVLIALIISASRPPHPVWKGWSGRLLCHWVCWSACENSWGGSEAEPEVYWLRVVGYVSVPVFARIASWPLPKRLWISGYEGWRP